MEVHEGVLLPYNIRGQVYSMIISGELRTLFIGIGYVISVA